MLWLIGATTLVVVGIAGSFGTIGTAVIVLAAVLWLLAAFRPVEAGPIVAGLARRRFE
jgi:hypothetical protein